MSTVTRVRRKSSVLTPSSLPCLSTIPTVNLTVGCLHGCLYCYARSYREYPGEGRIIVYENTLEKLQDELSRRRKAPRVVYFSPSSDLFQPIDEVLGLGESIIRFLLSRRIGVSFLTKGRVPDNVLRLLCENADLVSAQIGIIGLDEDIIRTFETHAASPERRILQIETLVRAGVPTQARIDPILPTITDGSRESEALFAALAGVGITQIAVDVLFLRPAIVQSLRKNPADKRRLARLLGAFDRAERSGHDSSWRLPLEVRRETLARMQRTAAAHGIEVKVCGCENPDLANGSCNIAGKYPRLPTMAVQPALRGV